MRLMDEEETRLAAMIGRLAMSIRLRPAPLTASEVKHLRLCKVNLNRMIDIYEQQLSRDEYGRVIVTGEAYDRR